MRRAYLIARTISRSDGTAGVIAGIVLVTGLATALVASSPRALRETGLRDALVVLAELAVYSALAWWGRHRRHDPLVRDCVQIGSRIGVILVVIELLNLGIEHFVGDPGISAV